MADEFASARDARWFEDYVPGSVYEFGRYLVGEDELVDFARRYDPQPFHIDAEAAAKSHFGGIVASGWHTCAMLMRMMVDDYISAVAGMGSPGVEAVRWLKPVRPGDVLRARATISEVRRSQSKPDRGIVRSLIETLNQDDTVVMTLETVGMVACREPTAG